MISPRSRTSSVVQPGLKFIIQYLVSYLALSLTHQFFALKPTVRRKWKQDNAFPLASIALLSPSTI